MKGERLLNKLKTQFNLKWLRTKTIVEDRNKPGSMEYIFTLPIKEDIKLPILKLKQIILQNPWCTTSQPLFKIKNSENGMSLVEIAFRVLNSEKGLIVENEIKALLSDL